MEEAKGRLEKSEAEVLQEEEGMAKVDGELQGGKDQIKAHLREEEERKERRRREERAGGDDLSLRTRSSEEVGVWVEGWEGEEGGQSRAFFWGGVGRQRVGCGGGNSPAALCI